MSPYKIIVLRNESPSSTCVTDSLGRVACLPSLPMASVLFSVLSIVKAVFDLNIYPLVREYETSATTVRMSCLLFLRFLPCFLATALFRVSAISLLFVFLDWWSLIPCILLFLLNLMTFGLSFKRFSSSPRESMCEDMNSVQLNRYTLIQIFFHYYIKYFYIYVTPNIFPDYPRWTSRTSLCSSGPALVSCL